MIYAAIGLGVLVIGVLAWKVYGYWQVLEQHKQRELQAEQQWQQKQAEHQAYLVESITVIVRSYQDDQMDTVEVAIRLWKLLSELEPAIDLSEFAAIEQVYRQTAQIPRREAWKELAKKDKRRYQQQMDQLVDQYGDLIKASVKGLPERLAKQEA